MFFVLLVPCVATMFFYLCTNFNHYMKRNIVLFLCCLLTTLVGANNINELYRQYLSSQGVNRLETGNMILCEAVQYNLIDSIESYKNHTEEMQAYIHYAVASYAWEQNDLDAVVTPAEKALELSISLDNIALQGDCYHLLGAVCQMKGDVYHAIEYFELCYNADRKLNDPDRMSSSLNNLAGNYLSADQAVEAEKVILRAIELERNMDRPEKLAIRLGMASDIYLKLDKPQAALPYITEAFELDSLGGRDMKMAIRLSQRASVYEALERYNDAKTSLLKAISILAGTRNVRSTAICYNQLGNLALRDGHLHQAEEYYGHAVRLSRQCNDMYAESKATRGLSEVLRSKDPVRSLAMLERHVQLAETIFSENTSKKLSQLQAKYNQAEKEHEVQLLKQKLEYKHLLFVWFGLFLCVVIILCGRFFYLYKKTKMSLYAISKKQSSVNHGYAIEGGESSLSETELIVHLTKREREIIKLSCKGMLDKEIASLLNISGRTVGTHKANIFRKCGVSNTVELVNFANQYHLLDE